MVRRLAWLLVAALLAGFGGCGVYVARALSVPPVDDLQPRHHRRPPASPTDLLARFLPPAGSAPRAGTPWFLVVGDSVSAGVTMDPARFGHNASWALQLQRRLAASGRPWSLDDLACPGETTASYATGCPLVFLTPALHGAPQREAALRAVSAHADDLRLIVVELGANDLVNARRDHAPLAPLLAAARTRLGSIVDELEGAAPEVPVVLATVYDPYTDAASVEAVDRFNAMITSVAGARGTLVADFHAAINGSGRPLCTLVDCAHHDIHPTVTGHARLAGAVLRLLA